MDYVPAFKVKKGIVCVFVVALDETMFERGQEWYRC